MLYIDVDHFKDGQRHPRPSHRRPIAQRHRRGVCAHACEKSTRSDARRRRVRGRPSGRRKSGTGRQPGRDKILETMIDTVQFPGTSSASWRQHRHRSRPGRRHGGGRSHEKTPTWRFMDPRGTGAARSASSSRRWDERMKSRRVLELQLRNALAKGEFDLYYQPIVNLARATRSAVARRCSAGTIPRRGHDSARRASSRWRRSSGCISALGEWVILATACRAAALLAGRGLGIAVNLSAVQLRRVEPDRAVPVDRAGGLRPASPSRLEVEITEAVLLQRHARRRSPGSHRLRRARRPVRSWTISVPATPR